MTDSQIIRKSKRILLRGAGDSLNSDGLGESIGDNKNLHDHCPLDQMNRGENENPLDATCFQDNGKTNSKRPNVSEYALSMSESRQTDRTSGSAAAKRRLMADLKAEEDLMKTAMEFKEKQFQLKQNMIRKRLQVEKQIIDEETEFHTDEQSNNEIHDLPNDVNKTENVQNWVDVISEPLPQQQILISLTEAMTKLVSSQETLLTRDSQTGVMEKFMLRQNNHKDLPFFSGLSEEWPQFICCFEQSNSLCSFSNAENMLRLQKALKGKAKDAVSSMLTVPNNLPVVMQTLKLRFGRDELILEGMIEKIKSIPNFREDKIDSLLEFTTAVTNLVSTIQSINCKGHLQNPILLKELMSKLPFSIRLDWGRHLVNSGENEPNLLEFDTWLQKVALAASKIETQTCTHQQKSHPHMQMKREFPRSGNPRAVFTLGAAHHERDICPICGRSHQVEDCPNFKSMSLDDKWEIVRSNHLCFSCLCSGHSTRFCRKRKECGQDQCPKFHNLMLHDKNIWNQKPTGNHKNHHSLNHTRSGERVLLRMLPVILRGPQGSVHTYALCDEGASLSLVEQSIAQQLGVKGRSEQLSFQTINGSSNLSSSLKVEFEISDASGNQFHPLKNVRTIQHLNLPSQTVTTKELQKRWPHLNHSELINLENVKPTILLGQDNFHLIVPQESYCGPRSAPVLTKCILGCSISGHISAKDKNDMNQCFHFVSDHLHDDLHMLVKKSFELESMGVRIGKKLISKDEEQAIKLLNNTLTFKNGHWEIGLPWKKTKPSLPESKLNALKRLKSVEKAMDKDLDYGREYCKKMEDYINKGYARKLTKSESDELTDKTWFLPHFGVKNVNKPGKLRIVFDAAAISKGTCLNKELFCGPDLLTSLVSVLFKFRQRKVAVCADIKEMFLQINIKDEDKVAQRYLYRGMDRKNSPEIFEMKSMIFGAVSSPFCAHYIRNHNAVHFGGDKIKAIDAIKNRHYMDDYLDSMDSIDEAIQISKEVIKIHSQGGFEIRNWISNSKDVLNAIPSYLRPNQPDVVEISDLTTERVLGLNWNSNEDRFGFKLNKHKIEKDISSSQRIPTKREILRIVMSVFDPLGFVSNITIKARILLQDIWRTDVGWDDSLPAFLQEKWKKWLTMLQDLESIKLNRCYNLSSHYDTCQLHVFCDASEKAYAAVAYFRFVQRGSVTVSFVMSRARVAPLRPTSIPRLELQAALMGARLATTIKSEHDIEIISTHFWSDSTTVLLWLRSDARKYKQFVAHRVGEIEELSDVKNWNHVPTAYNVADDATRDQVCEVNSSMRWLTGPSFLFMEEENWPKERTNPQMEGQDPEMKIECVHLITESIPVFSPSRFSSWRKLLRSTAWALRFVQNIKKGQTKVTGELTSTEMNAAEIVLIKHSQNLSFQNDVNDLENNKQLTNRSRIFKLSPFKSENGIIRMHSRLVRGNELPIDTKMPIIIDSKEKTTKLIIQHYHELFGHHGQELVTNELRQKFYILGIRRAVRSAWSQCNRCRLNRAKQVSPKMAPLPQSRLVSHVRPFTNVGLDYFGPLEVTIGRRREKRYGALFTCLSTRAVHLELSHSLNTDSAIMAIRRLGARRGYPAVIYSDNGKNFVGADRELKAAMKELDPQKLQQTLSNYGTEWHFNPPASPHMGGSWERLIRSVKQALRAVLKERAPKEEILLTLFAEAEAVVNSRPLTHVSIDPMDKEALTPNHFLIGCSSTYQRMGVFNDDDFCLRRQWRVAQRLADMFWSRWIREYLPTLTRRTKWTDNSKPVLVDDIVLIADPNSPRNVWPKGKVVAVYPGKDEIIRVVDVKTEGGMLRRSVHNLCVLDFSSEKIESLHGVEKCS